MSTDIQKPVNEYPKYYRKAGKCVKVVNPTETRTIILPPDVRAAERFTTTWPTPERMQAYIQGMDVTTEEEFKSFLFTFYKSIRDEHNAIAV